MVAAQFANSLDYVVVAPLGPDIALDLGMPLDSVGTMSGAYSLAAVLGGLLAVIWIDRFERRAALVVACSGLLASTLVSGLAQQGEAFILARFAAGFFGSIVSAAAMVVVIESVPVARRARALSLVIGSVVLSAMVGIPLALYLSALWGWQAPFLSIVCLEGLVVGSMVFLLPTAPRPATRGNPASAFSLLGPKAIVGYAAMFSVTLIGALIVPNLSAYLQFNLNADRPELILTYFMGTTGSLLGLLIAGRLVDRVGHIPIVLVSAIAATLALIVGFIRPHFGIAPAWTFIFVLDFALAVSYLGVLSFASFIPTPGERGGFISLLGVTRHVSNASGAFLSVAMLGEAADRSLIGISQVASISVAATLLTLVLLMIGKPPGRASPPAC